MHKSGALEQASPREPRKGEGRREVMKRGLEELLHWQSSKKPAACPGPCAVQCVESIKGKEKTSESEGKTDHPGRQDYHTDSGYHISQRTTEKPSKC